MSIQSRISIATNILLGTVAIGVGGRVAWDIVDSRRSAAVWEAVNFIPDWSRIAADGKVLIDSSSQSLVVLVFSDLQCPFCRKLRELLVSVSPEFPEMSVVFRHLPLEKIHENAREAANAAECAHAQGRFATFHDVVLTRQSQIGERAWTEFAELAGVNDLDEFSKCFEEKPFDDVVTKDATVAGDLGFTSAPTIVLNGTVYRGAPFDKEALRGALRRARSEEIER